MKVAVIIDTWFPAMGGGQTNVWEISKRIASKKIQIDIITRNCGKDNLEKVPHLNVFKLGKETQPDNFLGELFFLINLFFFLLKKNYNLINVHPFLPALTAKLVSFLKKKPIILTVHGTRLFENHSQLTPGRLLEKIILTKIRYDLVISVTDAFCKIKNINNKIEVVHNGINIEEFDQVSVKKATYPKILWVGRFDPVKRVNDLILATKIVSKKIKNLKLVLVGYGYDEEKIKELVSRLQLTNVQFKMVRGRKDLIKEYKSSHLFVLPSVSEGQPLTLLEAQAARVAVVATNVGGIPEILKHDINGLLVPPNKSKILARAIIKGLKKRKYLARNGYESIKKRYNWREIAEKTLKIYNSLLNAI